VPRIQCPKCGEVNHLDGGTYWNYSGTYKCAECGIRMSVMVQEGHLRKTPEVLDFVAVNGVPSEIDVDFLEAQKCYAAEAYKATAVMCRRTLETVADLQHATGNGLFEKIKDLYDREIITKGTFEIATQVRLFGNYGAHPKDDLLGGVTKEDAGVVLEITQHLLKDAYEIPEKTEKLRQRLQKKGVENDG